MQFSRMHVFRIARPFTHAATLPDRVPRAIANARRALIRLGEEMSGVGLTLGEAEGFRPGRGQKWPEGHSRA